MELYIAEMLRRQKRGHLSFHTPGHKRAGADITELSYSDNLYAPHGVIAKAERDAACILGAERSFFLTDGSTCGVFSMIACLRALGKTRLAVPEFSHPSVFHACEVLGISPFLMVQTVQAGIPEQPSAQEMQKALAVTDALLLTSPDYYGYFPDLAYARALCDGAGKPLLLDGAHGSHLHFTELHAGKFGDLWVDGVHKSLPALTQGAVVSAKSAPFGELLENAVKKFRTTSPSYPILASVEYAVKYPRNLKVEEAAQALKGSLGAVKNPDWSKLLLPFGDRGEEAQAALEKHSIYPEFNDGNYLMFYLSPCTKLSDLKRLGRALKKLPRGKLSGEEGKIPIYSEER